MVIRLKKETYGGKDMPKYLLIALKKINIKEEIKELLKKMEKYESRRRESHYKK